MSTDTPAQDSHPTVSNPEIPDTFLEQFQSLEIPANIDPRLLALWLEREQEEIRKHQRTGEPAMPPVKQGQRLGSLFGAYIGIAAMCLIIILGLVQGRESAAILIAACKGFLGYGLIGFIVGSIVERCLAESVETLLREIIRRSDAAAAAAAETSAESETPS